MKINQPKIKWLFNFSSSYSGGGLKRVVETAKWFDKHEGATFIINSQAKKYLDQYNKKNTYISILPSKLKRLFNDGYYMSDIILQVGTPDVYFSYGIPVFYKIGKINWFHISNALTITTSKIFLPFMKRVQMIEFKKRILKSMKYLQIVTGESEFSINFLKKASKNKYSHCLYEVLPNGYDLSLIKTSEYWNPSG